MEKENSSQNIIKCPKFGCHGELYKTGNLHGMVGDISRDGSYDSPTIPEYQCRKCESIFSEDELSKVI
jgi:hypothetical protein